jgi:ubiquinone/menaquinone biosynthesis C-methylase UbiE
LAEDWGHAGPGERPTLRADFPEGDAVVSARAFRDLHEFKSWNDAMVDKYDVERFHDHPSPLIRYIERKRVRRILALLGVCPGDRVLEIGCGAGNILAQIPSNRRCGIDLAESLLAKAARRMSNHGYLVQGDAEHLPFPDRSWERVYCSEVLEHIPAPSVALAEMRRIVTRGGVAVVSVPNERLINTLKATLRASGLYRVMLGARSGDYQMPERMDDEWHLHVFDLAGLLAMIPPGLRVTRIEGIPFRWLPLRYVVRCQADGEAR